MCMQQRPVETLLEIQKQVECEGDFLSDFVVEQPTIDEDTAEAMLEGVDPKTRTAVNKEKVKFIGNLAKRIHASPAVIKTSKRLKTSASSKTFVAPSL